MTSRTGWPRIVLLALLSGCALVRMKEQRQEMDTWRDYCGSVRRELPTDAPVVVVMYTHDAPHTIVRYDVLLEDGGYRLVVPPGKYRVLAFEDRNRNFAYDEGEPIGFTEHPESRGVHEQLELQGPELMLPARAEQPPPFPIDLSADAKQLLSYQTAKNFGAVTSLDDPRFSSDNASMGLWSPLDFRAKVGGGLFFLEPYDPAKIPVLFVHGIGGSPANWKFLIAHLDRERFQPWVMYYPSGASLELVALIMSRMTTELHARLGFDQLYVVAYSMGGLVARSFIGQLVATGEAAYLKLFVTFSTPWGGHRAAEMMPSRVRLAPAWEQMRPSSSFVRALFSHPLPEHAGYCLFFSHAGNRPLMRGSNDGTVTIASQLRYAAQDEADAVFGIEESHVSILQSARSSELLNRILDEGGCAERRKSAPQS